MISRFRRSQLLVSSAICATACAMAPQAALAGGFALEHQNAAALANAFAGVEAERGKIAYAAYNPASIAAITAAEFDISATGVSLITDYENASGALLGVAPIVGTTKGRGVVPTSVVPNITIATPIGDRLSIGVIVNSRFGLKTDYGPTSVVRYQARHSELSTVEISPIAAFKITDAISVGGGMRFQFADLNLSSTIDAGGIAAASMVPGFLPQTSDLGATFKANDWAIGYTAGAQIDLSPQFHAGVSWLSRIDHDFNGEAIFDLAGSGAGQTLNALAGLFAADRFATSIATPGSVQFGARFDASDRFALLASGKRTFWSSFDVIQLSFNDGATPPETVTQNWSDSWQASFGGEWKTTSETTLRAGVMWDQSPVNAAFSHPRVPDGDRFWIGAGLSQAFGERVGVDVGIAYAFFKDAHFALTGAEPENLFRGSFAGDFGFSAVAVSGTLRYKF